MTDQEMQATEEEVVLDAEEQSESSTDETVESLEQNDEAQSEAKAEDQEQEGESKGTPPWLQEVIDRQTRKWREEQRRAQALEQELQQVRAQLPETRAPEIPPLPDPYDDDFEAKARARDQAILARAQYDAQQRYIAEQESQRRAMAAQQEQAAVVQAMQTYTQRANEAGISSQDLQAAANTVSAYGMSDQIVRYILNDEHGPQIAMHLASHPQELIAMGQMDPTRAAVHIATQISPNLKPAGKKSTAPPPPDTLGGGGAPPREDGPEGATYE
jgi:hypothetical protein